MFDYDLEDEIKHAKILFLDDLFKIEPNAGELKSLFDIIDFRYRHNLQTIISSEKRLSEIEQIDEAIAGRILERCGSFVAGVSQADGRNYRKEKYAAELKTIFISIPINTISSCIRSKNRTDPMQHFHGSSLWDESQRVSR